MGLKLVWNCDGCGTGIEQDDATKSGECFKGYAESRMIVLEMRKANPEVFCAICLPHAEEYWDAKATLATNCLRELNGRIENHRKRFWASIPKSNVSNLVAVK